VRAALQCIVKRSETSIACTIRLLASCKSESNERATDQTLKRQGMVTKHDEFHLNPEMFVIGTDCRFRVTRIQKLNVIA